MGRPRTIRHQIDARRWRGPALRLVVLSDLHIVYPWTSLAALADVVSRVNLLEPDIILIPGDFLADPNLIGQRASAAEIVTVLEYLEAPLGTHATLGNHDWADCALAIRTQGARNSVAEAVENSRLQLYTNTARNIGPFWLAGTDSMIGMGSTRRPDPKHDLKAALTDVPDGVNLILMAHEPDLWAEVPDSVHLTVSGHTHAGQITLGNWRPLTPSRYGQRFAHGLISEGDRHLVVSGGLGYTGIPIRIGAPPEITVIELSPVES